MYVSELTIDMGEKGKQALELLFSLAHSKNLIPHIPEVKII
jgi:predicted solute-binding protein